MAKRSLKKDAKKAVKKAIKKPAKKAAKTPAKKPAKKAIKKVAKKPKRSRRRKMEININDDFYLWVRDQVAPGLRDSGFEPTPSALDLLVHSLQAQMRDEIVDNNEDLFSRAEKMVEELPRVSEQYVGPQRIITYNQMMHILVRINERIAAFPSGRTV